QRRSCAVWPGRASCGGGQREPPGGGRGGRGRGRRRRALARQQRQRSAPGGPPGRSSVGAPAPWGTGDGVAAGAAGSGTGVRGGLEGSRRASQGKAPPRHWTSLCLDACGAEEKSGKTSREGVECSQ